jgi:hypothetical protein
MVNEFHERTDCSGELEFHSWGETIFWLDFTYLAAEFRITNVSFPIGTRGLTQKNLDAIDDFRYSSLYLVTLKEIR